MRTLLEKEIRLLLPAFVGAMVLAILPVWLLPYGMKPGGMTACLLLLGTLILVLSSYGREIGCKTLSFMLAQPLERTRIWWTKIAVLAVCVVLVFEAWWLSIQLCSVVPRPWVLPPIGLVESALFSAALVAGGLWLTLLLRQTVAAFWLAILIPIGACLAIEALGGKEWMMNPVLGIYAATAFFLARRQFLHLQDTAWTGGVISFGRARAATERTASREHRPWSALIGKELQLQQITLFAMACLFVLHLGAVVLRKTGAEVLGKPMLSALELFGVFWFIVPLLAGSQSVADERQLGTLDGLLCLPVSRRAQFVVKLTFVLVVGGLLSATLLCVVDRVASAMGVGVNWSLFDAGGICLAFLAISLVGFYASTLTSGMVPALGAGAVLSIALWLLVQTSSRHFPWPLWRAMAIPALTAALIWLAHGNFRFAFESGRRWRRNTFVLTTIIVSLCASTLAIYHRAWEFAMPLEGPHGPARLPAAKPIVLGNIRGTFAAVLPDGRLWVDRLVPEVVRPVAGGIHFVAGSNWVAALAMGSETVAIRSDGTLWVSEKPLRPWVPGSQPPLVQFGTETDWQSLASHSYSSMLLLKRDGTLWKWGTNWTNKKPYPGLFAFKPHRLGANSDWARILSGVPEAYAWKQDGSAWAFKWLSWAETNAAGPLDLKLDDETLAERAPGLDHIQFQSMNRAQSYGGIAMGVREDGTLWYWDFAKHWWAKRYKGASSSRAAWPVLVQVGRDSNWAEAALGHCQLVALKTDGSIWKWNFDPGNWQDLSTLSKASVRMGTHHDWVGLGSYWDGTVTLSADGSLWRWRRSDLPLFWSGENAQWLAPSRRPVKIENIFGAPE